MKDKNGKILYIGKAGSLKRRVSGYFRKSKDNRREKLMEETKIIDYKITNSSLEALILEAELIKKRKPPFNVKEKDDKSFLYIEITKEKFPRVVLVRGKDKSCGERFGPFTNSAEIREGMKILRRIFPWNTHTQNKIGKFERPCLNYQIGLCPGTCVSKISQENYRKRIKNLKNFLRGKRKKVISDLEKEMEKAAEEENFERASELRNRLFALRRIKDTSLLKKDAPVVKGGRVEGYDISNISGNFAVGSMAVFENGEPQKKDYRKFKIRTVKKQSDTDMLKEVIERRLSHTEWPLPRLFLIDGGKPQINAAREVLTEEGIKIPVLGIAKGAKRKKNEFLGDISSTEEEKTLFIKIRDEAHRFAQKYHKVLRGSQFKKK